MACGSDSALTCAPTAPRTSAGSSPACPASYTAFTQVYPGYDKIASRRPRLARLLRGATYLMESTPLRAFGISHLAVFQKPPA